LPHNSYYRLSSGDRDKGLSPLSLHKRLRKPSSICRMSNPSVHSSAADSLPVIDLRDARLAAFLAWLVPGLGHVYQRRTGKGLLFMITILGIFAYGMWLGNGRVVYASTTNPIGNFTKFKERWHYACQVGIGLPALPALVQTWRVETGKAPLGEFERPPYTSADIERIWGLTPEGEAKFDSMRRSTDESKQLVLHEGEVQKWQHDLAFEWEVATVYTMMAGLLNILAICDARWGPLLPVPHPNRDPDPDDTDPPIDS
jgi:hypothetical protein